ncbi:hypothetical protein [Paenibacillus larvae]|uniref:hypothetical protein n=1 Tax=Paenibacillus larvae TaxID=1464 RepID=UPI00289278B0|nr:hypothetical protein [Paenibacillus larvae]MDT2191772.1 hypothetical protein [Paenibacillus larvae]MDT2304460.1 hypothetical protein [Paenibacillus larvae]
MFCYDLFLTFFVLVPNGVSARNNDGFSKENIFVDADIYSVNNLLQEIESIPLELIKINDASAIKNHLNSINSDLYVTSEKESLNDEVILKRAKRGVWKCSLEIGKLVVMNALPIAKIVKIKEYVKALGGVWNTAKLLVGATNASEKLGALGALIAELSGFTAVKKHVGIKTL